MHALLGLSMLFLAPVAAMLTLTVFGLFTIRFWMWLTYSPDQRARILNSTRRRR